MAYSYTVERLQSEAVIRIKYSTVKSGMGIAKTRAFSFPDILTPYNTNFKAIVAGGSMKYDDGSDFDKTIEINGIILKDRDCINISVAQ